jgi:hypothetical protein
MSSVSDFSFFFTQVVNSAPPNPTALEFLAKKLFLFHKDIYPSIDDHDVKK